MHEAKLNRAEADTDNRRTEDGILRAAISSTTAAPMQARAAISRAPAAPTQVRAAISSALQLRGRQGRPRKP